MCCPLFCKFYPACLVWLSSYLQGETVLFCSHGSWFSTTLNNIVEPESGVTIFFNWPFPNRAGHWV